MNLISIKEKDGKVSPLIVSMFEYLNKIGCCCELMETADEDAAPRYSIYQVKGHFYESINYGHLQHLIKNWFLNPKNKEALTFIDKDVHPPIIVTPETSLESVTKFGFGRIVNVNNMVHLKTAAFKRRKHTQSQAFYYFENGFVEVTKSAIKFHEYGDTQEEKISKKHVRPRKIEVIEDLDTYASVATKGKCFFDYMQRTCFVPIEEGSGADIYHEQDGVNYTLDVTKLHYFSVLIGYLCHNFRKRGCTDFAAVFSDNEEGGSGKGLIIQAIKELVSVSEVDCKRKPEIYDRASLTKDTQVKVYQDISSTFDLKDIYNETTEEGTIRRMRQAEVPVPYEDMWKVAITANYIIRGNKTADFRRLRVFRLFPFFNDKNMVREFYKHSFFSSDWEQADWNYFYNLMFRCVQDWLKLDMNQSKVHYHDESYLQDKLSETYPPEFIAFMEQLERNVKYKTGELFNKFMVFAANEAGVINNQYINKYYASNQNFFSRQVTAYLKEKDLKVVRNCNRTELMIK